MDGKFLNHLGFADDIVLISNDSDELQVELQINNAKTKIMSNINKNLNITLEGKTKTTENVESYTYVGQQITTAKDGVVDRITRRIRLGWCAFGKLSFILKQIFPTV
ncbi:hypothetical protein ILUMI_26102 [Ignelater luminosus]|uniref:Reverse transcriptase domain-containing protein n=1 Tax=Ignelater luminosus TaxID=2038154 RepID=A0A8K0FZ02_IGNLU|nr:hypothetical protein ILUMI_26102 [Ignelater luminosus]